MSEETAKRGRIGALPPLAMGALALIVVLVEGLTVWLRRTELLERLGGDAIVSLDVVAGIVEVVAAVAIVLFFSKARASDLGADLMQIGSGVLVTAAIWALAQLTQMVIGLARFGYIALYEAWGALGVIDMIRPIVPTLLAEAIPEELIWRGIVLIWVIDYLETKVSIRDPFFRAGSALLASGLLYALSEMPDQALEGAGRTTITGDLFLVTMTGLFFGLLYLRTRNLWIVIGVHMLVLWPMPLVNPWFDASRLIVLTAAILLVPDPHGTLTSNRAPQARREARFSRG